MPASVGIAAGETQDLLVRAQAGEADAFCELVRSHETRLLRQAMILCGNPTLAEDLAQDTLVEAWKCLRRYNGRCQFFTWLCAILLNRYRNTLRERRPAPFSSLTVGERDEVVDRALALPDDASPPDRAVELREREMLMRNCINKLPAKHQQVVYLRFYVDDSLQAVAAALGCSIGTVKSRLFHALEKLRGMNVLAGHSQNLQSGEEKR